MDDDPRTFRVEFPSATAPASCVRAAVGESFPCEIRHILQLHAAPEQPFRMENDELVPAPDFDDDILQASFVLWVQVAADGEPDYAHMQWSC